MDKLLDEAVKLAAARLAVYIIACIKAALLTYPDPAAVQHAVLLLDALKDFRKGNRLIQTDLRNGH
ncbi:hypothetical protein A2G96_18830 [Cupriavidus nantongensis]|uniref:Uncharacterized protein n=2 Tax=Cupriavidus nantongensis TaxID=1796606 RepID=A0A142JNH4_9BURK|nr:hypothetical protein A2G96_18830 [Cupriavidus nantongensis]